MLTFDHVNLVGTVVSFEVQDATGELAQSAAVSVQCEYIDKLSSVTALLIF